MDKILDFLKQEVFALGGFNVTVWMLACIGLVLLAILLIVIIVIAKSAKKKKKTAGAQKRGDTPVKAQTQSAKEEPKPAANNSAPPKAAAAKKDEPVKEAAVKGKYVIEKVRGGKYVFSLLANNGSQLFESEEYASETTCKNGIPTFVKYIEQANNEVIKTGSGEFQYVIKRPNGSYTSKAYKTETAAKSAAASVRRFCDSDKIETPQKR